MLKSMRGFWKSAFFGSGHQAISAVTETGPSRYFIPAILESMRGFWKSAFLGSGHQGISAVTETGLNSVGTSFLKDLLTYDNIVCPEDPLSKL